MADPLARPGIVAAMSDEAACLKGHPDILMRLSGVGPKRARQAADSLVAAGAKGLVSFGIAGGLDPHLAPGTLILASSVVAPDGTRYSVDSTWRDALRAKANTGLTVVMGALAASDRVVMTPQAKAELARATGCVAVDMESHAIAQAAVAAGLPFLVVRVVSDPAGNHVPKSALGGVSRDGHRQIGPVIRKLALRPWELPRLLELKRDTYVALDVLRGVVGLVGPGFCLGLGDQALA